MTMIDKLNLDRMNKEINDYIDEKELRLKINNIYIDMLDDNPSLKYILVVWIQDNKNKILECDISIQFIQKEIKNFKNLVAIDK